MLLMLHLVLMQRAGGLERAAMPYGALFAAAAHGGHALCYTGCTVVPGALTRPPISPVCCRREKDAEVSSLKQAVAERDVKLKSAKGELLEARLSLQQKDNELKVGRGLGWVCACGVSCPLSARSSASPSCTKQRRGQPAAQPAAAAAAIATTAAHWSSHASPQPKLALPAG